jgi:hypothetical protein
MSNSASIRSKPNSLLINLTQKVVLTTQNSASLRRAIALTLASGHMMRRIVSTSLGIVMMLFITGCSGDGDNDVPPSVTLRGQALADDISAAPIAYAECSFFSFGDRLRNRTTADANGMFELMLPSSTQGLLGCHPPGLPNLTLLTFVSTDGALPGTTLPEQGVEEVSPRNDRHRQYYRTNSAT